ncbi:hypothetical protein CYMTET_40982 [Cymbomonas tetramitiformis]|uniref:Uncharacterized protein n=1 Tax=Cymbomonas tetramitiformis TaxID=36881 RepID=A0AAE0F332_9CHLO|nr:hypothetical protein CYMTET_40982 [Cymbomonas tetramitiformis]
MSSYPNSLRHILLPIVVCMMVLYEFNSGYFLLNSSPPPAIKAIRSMTNGKVASFSSEELQEPSYPNTPERPHRELPQNVWPSSRREVQMPRPIQRSEPQVPDFWLEAALETDRVDVLVYASSDTEREEAILSWSVAINHLSTLRHLSTRSNDIWTPATTRSDSAGQVTVSVEGLADPAHHLRATGRRLHLATLVFEDVGSSSDEQLQRLSGAVHTVAHPPASPSADSKKPVPLQRLAPMRFINHEVRVKKLWEQPHGLPGIISPPMPSASLLTVGTHDPDATASVAGTAEAGGQRRSSSSSSPHGAKPVSTARSHQHHAASSRPRQRAAAELGERPPRTRTPPASLHQARRGPAAPNTTTPQGTWRSHAGQVALEQHHAGELSLARVGVASVSAAGLMFFAGGEGPLGKLVSTVDIYNPKEQRWSVAKLSAARKHVAAVGTEGGRALFGGGKGLRGASAVVDVYDHQSRQWTHTRLSEPRQWLAGAAMGEVVYFAGGTLPTSARWTDRVDCYDAERNEWLKPLRLSVPRTKMGVVAVSHYVLFAGARVTVRSSQLHGGFGRGGKYRATVDILDTRTQRMASAMLSEARQYPAAAATGTKAFIAGGFWCDVGDCNGGFDRSNAVDIFDAATASWDTMKLTQARSNLAGIGLGGPAVLFAGGTARSRPSEFFQNPKCFQNCLAKDPARHGRAAENSDKNKILYPTVKRLLKYSNRPVGVRSYSVDVYIEACDKWVVAELSVSRACMEGTAMLEEGGTYLVAVGGGELRTKWNLPFNMGGHDYYSSRVDMLRVDTKMCTVTNLNTGREYGVKP